MRFRTWLGWIAAQSLLVGIAFSTIAKASPPADPVATQHFFCNTGYTLDTCYQQISTLKTVVAKFPREALPEWTWVLVRSQDWKEFWTTLGVNPKSPAIACPEKRVTFIEEALVVRVPGRTRGLTARWHMGITELLNFIVEHEMEHVFAEVQAKAKPIT
jgi:hypothetical protein